MSKIKLITIVFMLLSLALPISATETTNIVDISDTYVNIGSPDTNYEAATSVFMVLNQRETYFKINLSTVSSKNIVSARLYFYKGGDGTIEVYNVTSSLNTSNVTWNTKPTTDALPIVTKLLESGNGWRYVDLNDTVKAWNNGTSANNGLNLKTTGVTIQFTSMEGASNNPYLEVVYESEYTPPSSTALSSSQGLFWVNYTWVAGSGNGTDSYNISTNGSWINGSTALFYNSTGMSPHGWNNISVYAFNSSGTGLLNTTPVSQNTQLTNNALVLTNVSSTYTLLVGDTLQIYPVSTDADGDTPTFGNTTTK